MKTIKDLFYLLNKINLELYLECTDGEKFNYIMRIPIDDFGNFDSVKTENILIVFDGSINFFDNVNNNLFGYW